MQGYDFSKTVSVSQKLKFSKTYEKRLNSHIEVVERKKRLKRKTRNIWKMKSFRIVAKLPNMQRPWPLQNGQCESKTWIVKSMGQFFKFKQNWPLCKGYSFCKIVNLSQTLKLLEEYEKRL